MEFPKASDLTPEIRQQLTKLLPVPSPEPNLAEGKEDAPLEEAFLENCNMEDESTRWKDEAKRHGEAYDEDAEEEGGHPHATQCRAQ